jgi:hypothetical protein
MAHSPYRFEIKVRSGSVLTHPVGPLAKQDTVFIMASMKDVKTVSIQKRNKTAQVNLRIAPELKAAADKAAADDQRSLTSLVEKLLVEHLKATGYLK